MQKSHTTHAPKHRALIEVAYFLSLEERNGAENSEGGYGLCPKVFSVACPGHS